MRLITASLVASTCVLALAGAAQARAEARTPTPTSTPPPTSTTTPAATPAPPQPAIFAVVPWVNARNQAQKVTANMGDTICAAGTGGSVAGSSRVIFNVSVPSDQALPGCGREGATITFIVDGQQAPQTATWHAGGFQALSVILGSPFANFIILGGEVEDSERAGGSLVPYIGDEPCGYDSTVYSDEQQPGCGLEGSQITFKLFDSQGNLIGTANEKGTWHAWDGVGDHLQQLTLTFGTTASIHVGNVGSGPGGGDSPWARLSLALASLGLAGAVGGFVLRRRATRL